MEQKYKVFFQTKKKEDDRHPNNEDSMVYFEFRYFDELPGKLLIVSDGIGSWQRSDQASRLAVQTVMSQIIKGLPVFYQERKTSTLEALLKDAFCAANEAVYGDMPGGGGATMSAVLFLDEFIIAANIGDSPIYWYSKKNDQLKRISDIQTVAEEKVKRGIYERYCDDYFKESHILLNCLGDRRMRREDIFINPAGTLEEGDFLLLASDGGVGYLREEEILEILQNESDDRLSVLFQCAGKKDDQTAIYLERCKRGGDEC